MDQSYTWRSENGPRGDDRENAPADVAREQTYHERQHGHLGNEGFVDGDFEAGLWGLTMKVLRGSVSGRRHFRR